MRMKKLRNLFSPIEIGKDGQRKLKLKTKWSLISMAIATLSIGLVNIKCSIFSVYFNFGCRPEPRSDSVKGLPQTGKDWATRHGHIDMVWIENGFWIGKFEITNAQYREIVEMNTADGTIRKEGNLPKTMVSWNEAIKFCERLTTLEFGESNAPKPFEFSLPTEKQWKEAYDIVNDSFFIEKGISPENANYGFMKEGPVEVGSHSEFQNRYSIWDLHGNVSEWVSDDCSVGGIGIVSKKIKGGNWKSGAKQCSVNESGCMPVGSKNETTGFRIMMMGIN